MAGGFSQSSTGALSLNIGSASSYGSLRATGSAILGGTLSVSASGYLSNARPGDAFTLLSAAAVSGTFSSVNLPGDPSPTRLEHPI